MDWYTNPACPGPSLGLHKMERPPCAWANGAQRNSSSSGIPATAGNETRRRAGGTFGGALEPRGLQAQSSISDFPVLFLRYIRWSLRIGRIRFAHLVFAAQLSRPRMLA